MNIIEAMKLATHGVKMTRLYWLDLVKKYPDDPNMPWRSSTDITPVYFVYNEEYKVLDLYNRYRKLIKRYTDNLNQFGFIYEELMADDYIEYRDELLDEALRDGKV